jgi:hypothetical protein
MISPRGRKPIITGLMSKTGVPSMASRPRTFSSKPSTNKSRQNADAYAIGSRLAALGEDAYQRPVRAVSGMTRAGVDVGFANPVEVKDHFDMRKAVQIRQGIGRKALVQLDDRLFGFPRIIFRLQAAAPNRRAGRTTISGCTPFLR